MIFHAVVSCIVAFFGSALKCESSTQDRIGIAAIRSDHDIIFGRRFDLSESVYRISKRNDFVKKRYENGMNKSNTLVVNKNKINPKIVVDFLYGEVTMGGVNTIIYLWDEDKPGVSVNLTCYLINLSQSLKIPIITWLREDSSGTSQIPPQAPILQLAPTILDQCEAMLSLLNFYNWKFFSIVTGKMVGSEYFISTLKTLAQNYTNTKFEIQNVIQINVNSGEEEIVRRLYEISDAQSRVVLFYGSREEAEDILYTAKKIGVYGNDFMWIVSTLVVGSGQMFRDISGILGLKYEIKDYTDIIDEAVLIWARSMEKIVNERHHYSHKYVQFSERHTPQNGGLQLYRKMLEVYSRKFTKQGTLANAQFQIVNLPEGHEWKPIGSWSKKGGLKIDAIYWPDGSALPPTGRPKKYHLKIVTLDEDPFVKFSDLDPKTNICPPMAFPCTMRNNETKCASGFCMDMLQILSERIGFDFDLFEVEDGLWGEEYDKGTWNGLVGAVMRNQADLCITSLKESPDRVQVIDFSVPFLSTGISIIVAVTEGVISPTAFLKPYDYICWCLVLVFSVHVTGTSIFIFEWLSPSGWDIGNKPIKEHNFSLFRSFWLIWGILFGSPVNAKNPRGMPGRFLANVWALFALVFIASYTANLATFMMTKDVYKRLSGLDDPQLTRASKSKLRFATIPAGYTDTYIRKNKDYEEMYEVMHKHGKPNVAAGVQAVKDGDLDAFIYDALPLVFAANQDGTSKLKTVGKWSALTGYGIAFPKKSKWLKHFNTELLKLQQNGTIERIQRFWLKGASKSDDDTKVISRRLGVPNIVSAFILLAIGFLASCIILVFEHVYFKYLRTRLMVWDESGHCGLLSIAMGTPSTFHDSVIEVIERQKRHKCKNPVCSARARSLTRDRDVTLLENRRLRMMLSALTTTRTDDIFDVPVGVVEDRDVIQRQNSVITHGFPRSRSVFEIQNRPKNLGQSQIAQSSTMSAVDNLYSYLPSTTAYSALVSKRQPIEMRPHYRSQIMQPSSSQETQHSRNNLESLDTRKRNSTLVRAPIFAYDSFASYPDAPYVETLTLTQGKDLRKYRKMARSCPGSPVLQESRLSKSILNTYSYETDIF